MQNGNELHERRRSLQVGGEAHHAGPHGGAAGSVRKHQGKGNMWARALLGSLWQGTGKAG